MTAKEKAIALVEQFYQHGYPVQIDRVLNFEADYENAKQCALIAVNEIIQANHQWHKDSIPYKYWQEVRTQIIKLYYIYH
jgi:hypothetical protein